MRPILHIPFIHRRSIWSGGETLQGPIFCCEGGHHEQEPPSRSEQGLLRLSPSAARRRRGARMVCERGECCNVLLYRSLTRPLRPGWKRHSLGPWWVCRPTSNSLHSLPAYGESQPTACRCCLTDWLTDTVCNNAHTRELWEICSRSYTQTHTFAWALDAFLSSVTGQHKLRSRKMTQAYQAAVLFWCSM